MTEAEFASYVELDAAVECYGAINDTDIVNVLLQKRQPKGNDSKEDDESHKTPKTSAAYQAILVFRKILEEQDADLANFCSSEQQLQEIIARKASKVSTKYFI